MSKKNSYSGMWRGIAAAGIATVLGVTGCSASPEPVQDSDISETGNAVVITEELITAAKSEGEVNFRFGGPLAMYEALVKRFNAEYPEITVYLDRNAGAAGGASTLTEWQAGVAGVDVFEGTDIPSVLDLAASGAIADLEAPNAEDFPDNNFIEPGMYASQNVTSVIGFNTAQYDEAAVADLKNWETLAGLEAGQASYVEPTLSSALAPLLYAQETSSLGDQWIKDFAASKPVVFEGTALARDALAAGQQGVAVGQFDNVMKAQVASGAPVGFVYPVAAPTWPASFFGVLENAPNPNAAKLFWAWMLSQETCEFAQGAPMFADCALTSAAEEEPVTLSDGQVPGWFEQPTDLFPVSNEQWKEAVALRETWKQAQP